MTAATLVSVMNGWRAGDMRRVHDFGVSCLIRGVYGTFADSQIPKFRTEMQPLVGLGMRRSEFSGHTRCEGRRIISKADVGGLHHRYERRAV